MKAQAEQLARAFEETRAATFRLFDLCDERDLHESPGFGYRPIIWHLAHIGVFEAYWLVQKAQGLDAPDARYERIFDPISTPREESKNLPTRAEMESYLSRVRAGVLGYLEGFDFDSRDPIKRGGYVFQLVLEHERQHQETLCYLFQMLDPSKKTRPASVVNNADSRAGASLANGAGVTTDEGEMVSVPAGEFLMGASRDSFAYDNEYPAREVFVPEFRIARLPVTINEFARFVWEGGYGRREFWTDEGWAWKEKEGWTLPLYWREIPNVDPEDGDDVEFYGWAVRGMFGEDLADLSNHPVTGVSFYEAEAYARFACKRLPTEAEWEKAASWDAHGNTKRRFAWGDEEPDPTRCNYGMNFWGTTPVGSFHAGASPYGCLDMSGNVWEWTSTPFEAFPGFEPFPYPEYSQVWFDGDHRVLKGGSWATSPQVLRTSFRNFFRRHFRIAFAGLRLSE
ncbi:MAG TPA: SUMF1/EgtB/PvdO family nonheme iron enzyme [Pyrinomonadaceae bacterium]|jgi:iron(II)-dependent oxidoreductase|nr:SUMF1/EgtB/PvdO family nonheme iron enzyme [Pyrinomonadaceae bacterium]